MAAHQPEAPLAVSGGPDRGTAIAVEGNVGVIRVAQPTLGVWSNLTNVIGPRTKPEVPPAQEGGLQSAA